MAGANSFRILINWKEEIHTEEILCDSILLTGCRIYYLNILVPYMYSSLQSVIYFERINSASEFYRCNVRTCINHCFVYERNMNEMSII